MIRKLTAAASAAALLSGMAPAFAGDPVAGESAFSALCQQCHHVTNPAGETLAGRPNMRSGPNLYGVIGRQAGSAEGFRFGPSLVAAGEAGLIWTAEEMVPFLRDPTAHLRGYLGATGARSLMAARVRDDETAQNLVAFLARFATPADPEPAKGGY